MNAHLGRRIRWIAPGAVVLALTVVATSAVAQPAAVRARPSPIKHIVVLYLENHSFDNLLGYWCDDNPGRCPAGGMPSSVHLSNAAVVTPSTSPDVVPGIRHTTTDQATAIDGGRMDGWGRIPGCGPPAYRCVTGYQPWQVPNLTTLAQHFAISDMTFSMQDSPSFFGHLYSVAASTDGFTGANPNTGARPGAGWGCDSGKTVTWQAAVWAPLQKVPTCVPDPSLRRGGVPLPNGGASTPTPVRYVPTIMDRLDAAGLPWRIYGAGCTRETVAADGLDTCAKSDGQYVWSVCPQFAECLYTGQDASLVPDGQFIPNATSGKLPAFSLVTAGDFTTSWHNGSSITAGDNWLGQLVAAVMKGPDWRSTALFITWDDCGCFYDQVAPGVNPDGTPRGPRVPMIIVSPYARQGFTDNTPATFASVLAFTEQNFGLPPLGVNDAHAYPYTNAFNFGQRPLRAVRAVSRPVPKGEHIQWRESRQDS